MCGRGTREEIFPRHRANSVRALAAGPAAGMAAAAVWFRGSCVSQSCGSRDGNPEVSPRAICAGRPPRSALEDEASQGTVAAGQDNRTKVGGPGLGGGGQILPRRDICDGRVVSARSRCGSNLLAEAVILDK